MFVEILLAVALGIIAGIFTGLLPGIHINLVATLVLSLSSFLTPFFSLTELAVFILAMSITHTFIDAIPSIYLGAPDASMVLSALPGHKMLLQGKGHVAVLLTVIGSYFTLLLSFILFWLFIPSMELLYTLSKEYIGWILVSIILLILLLQSKRILALFVFLLAGCFGLVVLELQAQQPLFHLFSGLFGVSLLCESLFQKTSIPEQKQCSVHIPSSLVQTSVLGATIAGFFSAFLPGFGASQAAMITTRILKNIGTKGFLILVGGLNTASMIISLCSFYVLDKARNGSILAIRELIEIDLASLVLFLLVVLVVGSIAVFVALFLSKQFAIIISKINYIALVSSVIACIVLLSFVFDGFLGLLILVSATAFGVFASQLNVGKSNLMGTLLVPVVLFFLL
jgi:putative membrane protein